MEKTQQSSYGKFIMDFPKSITEFEKILQKFPLKRILYKTIFRGKGLEFDTYRTFDQGDDASFIDWKATLRSNEILAKKYIEERDMNIYFIIDASSSMLFGSGDKLKAEYVAEVTASLAHLMLSSGDKAGLVMFNDKISKYLPSSSGKNQFLLITKFLSDQNLYGQKSNMSNALEFCLKYIKTNDNVFIIISDFLNIDKNLEKKLKIISSKFETIALITRDPLDEDLPKTPLQLIVQDPNAKDQMIIDSTIAHAKYKEAVMLQKKILESYLKKSGVDYDYLYIDKNFAVPIVSFLKKRALGGGRT
jgi:uncharacterized protein (DUF58 family)